MKGLLKIVSYGTQDLRRCSPPCAEKREREDVRCRLLEAVRGGGVEDLSTRFSGLQARARQKRARR